MSKDDDRCARKDCSDFRHLHGQLIGHVFVEAAKPPTVASGDAARVIAERWYEKWQECDDVDSGLTTSECLEKTARDGIAVGRRQAFAEAEAIAESFGGCDGACEQSYEIADAIAARAKGEK